MGSQGSRVCRKRRDSFLTHTSPPFHYVPNAETTSYRNTPFSLTTTTTFTYSSKRLEFWNLIRKEDISIRKQREKWHSKVHSKVCVNTPVLPDIGRGQLCPLAFANKHFRPVLPCALHSICISHNLENPVWLNSVLSGPFQDWNFEGPPSERRCILRFPSCLLFRQICRLLISNGNQDWNVKKTPPITASAYILTPAKNHRTSIYASLFGSMEGHL